MTTPTVANRLQDGTETDPAIWLDPWWPTISPLDYEGERTFLSPGYVEDDRTIHLRMSAITIDGVRYHKQDNYGVQLFTVKDDDTHETEPDGYCSCDPVKYVPLTYRAGEICEPCWLAHGAVVGKGKDFCPHK